VNQAIGMESLFRRQQAQRFRRLKGGSHLGNQIQRLGCSEGVAQPRKRRTLFRHFRRNHAKPLLQTLPVCFEALSQRRQLVQWLHGLDHRQAHASERYNSSIELGFQLREQAEPSVFPGLAFEHLISSIQDALTQEGRCILTEGLSIRKPWAKPGVQLSLNAVSNLPVKVLT